MHIDAKKKRQSMLNMHQSLSATLFPGYRRRVLGGILRKTSGLADVVAEALAPLSEEIVAAFIFGSVARATETMGSDIDVLIIGSVDFGAVIDALHPAQEQLAREINPKVFSTREWKRNLKEKNPFVTDIMTNPKIFLIGEERDLA